MQILSFLLLLLILTFSKTRGLVHGPGPGPQMQSRAVDTRITLEIQEGLPKGTRVGSIPTKPGFTYRFNEAPKEFTLNPNTGEIKTNSVLDREGLKNDRFDLVVLSSQPTYPIEVRIVVLDVNDNPPEFPESVINVDLAESAAAGTRILLDSAYDRDTGANGISDNYKIIGGNNEGKFRLALTANPTGETSYLHLETTGKLDRESQGFYLLNISAQDNGSPPKFGYLQVNVTILDVNDNPPIFDHSDYIVSLNETVPPGTPVLRVMATDNDLGDNAKISYYLSDKERQFVVDADTGVISTGEVLVCPPQQRQQQDGSVGAKSCVFTVFARDHGSPRQDGRTYVTVNLLDANDHDPLIKFRYFPATANHATVDENAGNGSVVAAISVVDQDEGPNGETSVRILTGNDLNHFRLDQTPSFDIVRVNGVLDREEISKYNLTIIATDRGNPARTSSAFLIIEVNDVNDHEPIFEKTEYSAVLSELSPEGSYVASIEATDEDSGVNSEIHYAFVSGNQNGWFSINAQTGLVTTIATLDREVQGTLDLNISARDGGPNPKWAYTQLKITILDENDEKPKFTQAKINASLSENSPAGSLIAMLTASDHDQGTNGSVTYTLHPSTLLKHPNSFALDQLTGKLSTVSKLDREKAASYEILIVAKDQGIPAQSSTATVFLRVLDVNDNPPKFYPRKYFVVVPSSVKAGAALVQVSASDLDEGENGLVTYELVSGADGMFTINSTSGVITLRTDFNHYGRNKRSAYDFYETDFDSAYDNFQDSKRNAYESNNGAYDYYQEINDHQKNKQNADDNHQKNKQNDDDHQMIYKSSKQMKKSELVKNGYVANNFDEDVDFVDFNEDADYDDYDGDFEIKKHSLNNNHEKDKQISQNLKPRKTNDHKSTRRKRSSNSLENIPVGLDIANQRLHEAYDDQIQRRITKLAYAEYQNSLIDHRNKRAAYEEDKVVHHRNPREATRKIYRLVISAVDGGNKRTPKDAVVEIVLDDHTEELHFEKTAYDFSIMEDDGDHAEIGRDVGKVSIRSSARTRSRRNIKDSLSSSSSSSLEKDSISESLTADSTRNISEERIDSTSDSLEKRFDSSNDSLEKRFDSTSDNLEKRLDSSSDSLEKRTDSLIDSFEKVGSLNVDWSSSKIEKDPQNHNSRANSASRSLDHPITDSLSASTDALFSDIEGFSEAHIEPKDKIITPANPRNKPGEEDNEVRLKLPKSRLRRDSRYEFASPESVSYFIINGDPGGVFEIDQHTGRIFTSNKVDREEKSAYALTIIARAGFAYAQTIVRVNILDLNDNKPDFLNEKTEVSLPENAAVGEAVYICKVRDPDSGIYSKISYGLSYNPEKQFGISETTGVVFLNKPISASPGSVLHLEIKASDSGEKRLTSKLSILISVEDVNDHTPVFDHTSYETSLLESTPVNTRFFALSASDSDLGKNARISYKITEGDRDAKFGIFPDGLLYVKTALDREEKDYYSLTIEAVDSGEPKRSSSVPVVIHVIDENDNAPQFTNSTFTFSVSENEPPDTFVGKLTAFDEDIGRNAELIFSLSASQSDFKVDPKNGFVKTLRAFDREELGEALISFEATVSDNGNPRLKDKVKVNVRVTDVNDNPPKFLRTPYKALVSEGSALKTQIVRLHTSDADEGLNGDVFYKIHAGNEDGIFEIDEATGVVVLSKKLDRERKDKYELSVIAYDAAVKNRLSASASVLIEILDENDNAPQFIRTYENINRFSTHAYEYPHNNEANAWYREKYDDEQVKTSASALDFLKLLQRVKDGGASDEFLRMVQLIKNHNASETELIRKMESKRGDGAFDLVQKLRNAGVFERSDSAYDVQRKIKNTLGDGYNDLVRKLRGGLDAYDYDNALIRNKNYDFASQSAYDLVQTLKNSLTSTAYDLLLEVKHKGIFDGSADFLSIQQIINASDESPNMIKTKISVIETTPINTELIRFEATDADLGLNSEITYSIASGNRKDTFRIDPNSGVLSLHKNLDYEELTAYRLNISASDSGNPKLSTILSFSVDILDANDNPPSFTNTAIVRQIREGIPVHTPIVTVTAEDPDSGANGRVAYAIAYQEPGDFNRHFGINPTTGVIHTLLPIDREKIDTFRLTVTATDEALPLSNRLSADKLVTVIVEDVNDNAPVFVSMNAAVLPNARNALIMNVYARDLDSSTNGLVTYELSSGSSDLFHLHRSTGALTLRKAPSTALPRYKLNIKATDEAVQSERKSTDAYITIISTSDDNNPGPVFTSGFYSGSVFENEAAGTSVLSVSARFGASAIEYYVTNVTGDDVQVDRLFDVDAKLGVLSTVVELDREAGLGVYEVEVYAIVVGESAGVSRTSKTKVRITVLDKNDSPPTFSETPLTYSASEDLGIGSVVATIKANDPDTIGTLKYTLLSSENQTQFTLDSESGVLRLADSLDRETKDVYKLIVRASDGIQHTDTTVTIQVTDTNDNPPVFLESAYSFDVQENAPRGSRIGQVRAEDPDLGLNAQLTYTVISDWANDVFSLNPQTGVFTLTSRLDYEEVQHYILVVQAQDSGSSPLSSTLTVYCNVIDLNDNAPIFDPMSYSNEIFENVSISTSVLSVSATDLDSGDNGRIEYSITSGDENSDFGITRNGTVYTKKILDRETRAVYNLIITGTDMARPPESRLSSTVQATITLKDVNDMSPEFISSNITSVPENSPFNTIVTAVKAIDRDEGRNGYIEYHLAEDDLNEEDKSVFSLGPVDGLLRVSGRIDRELKSVYVLGVVAKDRGDPVRSTSMRIVVKVEDVNDNSPVFDPRRYSASVAENASIGASVLQVSATDIDAGPNGRVRYTITDGDPNRDFTISEDTGSVRVAKNLNYERKSRYVLTVRAEDCADDTPNNPVRSDTAQITIAVSDINDNPPTFLDSPYLAYVMENVVPPNGGYVVTVRAFDADTPPFNSLVRYFIKEGDTDVFRINASTGEVSLLRALDREEQSEYTLSLVAMDTGSPPLTGAGIVKIIVQDANDNSPQFKRQSYKATITENRQPGTWILTPEATDKDTGLNSKLKFNLLGDKSDRFEINQETGEIKTKIKLDREETERYELTLTAQDSAVVDKKITAVNLTIIVEDENDNYPKFAADGYDIFLPDSLKTSDFIFGARAIDIDQGINSKITYKLIKNDDSNYFSIDEETGVIKAKMEIETKSKRIFNLQIEASDGGNPRKTAIASLKIHLQQTQLFPIFDPNQKNSFTLKENLAPGTLVTTIKARSPKKGNEATIKYAIAGGNVGEALAVNSASGEVKINGPGLDYETAAKYEIWFEAKDSDFPSLSSVMKLTISVTDANDNPPVFENALYNATILEEELPPVVITKIRAKDADSGPNSFISYRLIDDFDSTFEIDEESGEISTNAKLDREEVRSYELVVEAVDHGEPQLTGSSTVLITVLDKNDNPPRFTRLFSVNVTENAEIDSFVIKVTSSDLDEGENANATYSFAENPGGKFKIDPISGNVTVSGLLDREQQDEYLLKIAAVDGAWRAETPLTITIQDQNDNAPEFEHSFYSFNFPELQEEKAYVGRVVASDRDKQGPNSVISYSLQQPSDCFTVNPADGKIYTKKSLKYKYSQLESSPENVYTLTIIATDNGKPPMSSECVVNVNVIDANNNPPRFKQREWLAPVPLDSNAKQRLVRVEATDELDFGINAEIVYVITGGNGSVYFEIDRNSGWISLKDEVTNRFKKEENARYRRGAEGSEVENSSDFDRIESNDKSDHSTIALLDDNAEAGSYKTTDYENNDNSESGFINNSEEESSIFKTNRNSRSKRYKNDEQNSSVEEGNRNKNLNAAWQKVRKLGAVFTLRVKALDKGIPPRSDEAFVKLVITGENKHGPIFTALKYQVIVPENEPLGSTILTVSATDADEGPNGMIRYEISEGNELGKFEIDSNSGGIKIAQTLDFDSVQEYNLNITAFDLGFKSKKAVAMLTITLTDINDNPPVFNQTLYEGYLAENKPPNTYVCRLQATDLDSPKNAVVRYKIASGSGKDAFTIDASSGVVRSTTSFDYEEKQEYFLEIVAYNPDSTMKTSTRLVIHITGINEFYPKFTKTLFLFDVSESAEIGTKIGEIHATDQDLGEDGEIFYLFVGASNDRGFSINPLTGAISVSKHLDRETQSRVVLTVLAKNAGGIRGNDTAEAQVVVTIQDGNDPPEFAQKNYEAEISESAAMGSFVVKVKAVDKDVRPQNNQFSYAILGCEYERAYRLQQRFGRNFNGDSELRNRRDLGRNLKTSETQENSNQIDEEDCAHVFKIDPQSGEIETAKKLDREKIDAYTLVIGAIDTGFPPQTGTAMVKIQVGDVNDNGPIFENSSLIGEVYENSHPGTKIMVLEAKDPDLPPNGAPFTYRITEGEYKDYVSLDKHSGVLTTTYKIFDREALQQIRLTVEVEDSGNPKMKSSHILTIKILDQNDSPSTPRSAHVLVYTFNQEFPIGKIAEVQPNDPDTSGNYTCRIVQANAHNQILSVNSGCDLHAKKINLNQGYSLSVLGNDGLHADVTSSITVEFINFDNFTVEESITIRVEELGAEKFLADYYGGFLELLKGIFSGSGSFVQRGKGSEYEQGVYIGQTGRGVGTGNERGGAYRKGIFDENAEAGRMRLSESAVNIRSKRASYSDEGIQQHKKGVVLTGPQRVMLYGINEVSGGLELTLAVKIGSGYKQRSILSEELKRKQSAINSFFRDKEVKIDYNPCLDGKQRRERCENSGVCNEAIEVKQITSITNSPNIIFTSPLITHDYHCTCLEGFTGQNCNLKQNPCAPNPCKSGGFCRRQAHDFTCVCPSNKRGKLCDLDKGNPCDENPCANGGSCKESPDGSAFFCLCRLGYRGNRCESLVDSCRPNPCLHGGLCVPLKPGYKCSCTEGRYGRHCEKSTYAFHDLSYSAFPSLDPSTNDITFIFSTTKPTSLLIYNYGTLTTGGRSDFVAVELLDGRAVLSFGGARSAITRISVGGGKEGSLADGGWYKVTATRNGRVVSLSAAGCTEQGDVCGECRPGDGGCYADGVGQAGTLNFNNQPVLIGGLRSADPVLERPGQVHSDDFVGCVHSVTINGRQLNLSDPIDASGVDTTCMHKSTCRTSTRVEGSAGVEKCGRHGSCSDRWHTTLCECEGEGNENTLAPNCFSALEPMSFTEGGFVEFVVSRKHKRMQLLDGLYKGSSWVGTPALEGGSVVKRSENGNIRSISKRSTRYLLSYKPDDSSSLLSEEGTIIKNNNSTSVLPFLEKHSLYKDSDLEEKISDSENVLYEHLNWDTRRVKRMDSPLTQENDFPSTSHSPDTENIIKKISISFRSHDPNGLLLYAASNKHFTTLELRNGEIVYTSKLSARVSTSSAGHPEVADGAWHKVTLLSQRRILKIILDGKNIGDELDTASVHDFLDPYLSYLSVAGIGAQQGLKLKSFEGCMANFTVNGEIQPFNGSGSVFGEVSKRGRTNQGCTWKNGELELGVAASPNPLSIGITLVIVFFIVLLVAILVSFVVFRLRKQSKEKPVEGKQSGNSDVVLHSNEQSVVGFHVESGDVIRGISGLSKKFKERDLGDLQRGQRPDIIEREVLTKRDEPPIPPLEHPANDLNSELPEHYDLENASSIAPSDIDIIYHYKGYREAAGLRKYKPPVGGYHHKHGSGQVQAQAQHRHGFPPRAPPVVASTQTRTHQTTPLARLSPSSEMSAQQPRILTLQDISGKPLQSALLATSSSAGVGKDILHSNSERSSNLSQLSGRSKTAAEATELRTSSLVSTLDAVSQPAHLRHSPGGVAAESSSTTDESGNDSFTCSEIEYDNASLPEDKYKPPSKEENTSNSSNSGNKNNLPPPSYDGFDSSYRGSMSTLVASDDELVMGGVLYRPNGGGASSVTEANTGWDYLLSWGPNFESLAGVFKDIAELPDAVNGRVAASLRLTNVAKASEEYV